MKKMMTLVAVALLLSATIVKADDNVKIGKQNIMVKGGLMTPEALWAMGRIGAAASRLSIR